jgi:hypothetical protein
MSHGAGRWISLNNVNKNDNITQFRKILRVCAVFDSFAECHHCPQWATGSFCAKIRVSASFETNSKVN